MKRALALAAAEPDALGLRWAARRTADRVYLAWQDADGRTFCQIRAADSPRAHWADVRAGSDWEPLPPVIKKEPAPCP